MTVQRWNGAAIALVALSWMLCMSVPALAQTAVSSGDIQRLQDEVYQASADVSRLRTTDALQAGRLQDDLDRLREDVIYLKVKLRKESSVSRSEYNQVRDDLLELRSRARGETRPPTSVGNGPTSTGVSGGSSGSAPVYDDRPRATTTRAGQSGIPVGQEIDVRIQTELTSDTAQVEDRFEATTLVDLYQGDRVHHPGRLGDAWAGHVSESGVTHGSKGKPYRRLQSDHRSRPQLPDARHGDGGHRELWHQR